MAVGKSKISLVFPVYNESDNLPELYSQVRRACESVGVDYEMIFVNDGSTDSSLHAIRKLKADDDKVRYLSLSRNFGHQNAIFAGMSHAKGDCVITMDADLQHPPSMIGTMVKMWRDGAEVVYTTKKSTHLSVLDHALFRAFYWFISKVSRVELEFGQSDFRLLDRKVVDVILRIPEYHKFLRGQVKWIGFKQAGLSYDVDRRYEGKTKMSYRRRLSFAMDGIFAFSRYPLHLIMLIGITVLIGSSMFILVVLYFWLLRILNIPSHMSIPPGFATLAIGIFFLGSVQLIAIGLMGEYVGRIYDQTKGRPVFIVSESSDQGEGA